MKVLATLVKSVIPNYLAELPIPDSFGGWFRLSAREWISLAPLGVFVAGLSYASFRVVRLSMPQKIINISIQKENPKVVDIFDIEDIDKKVSFCRCWKSKKFPYCDGAHGAHNKETGDNVGPVVLKRKDSA